MSSPLSLLPITIPSGCTSRDAAPTDAIQNDAEVLGESDAILDDASLNLSYTEEVVPRFQQESYVCAVASALSAVYIWDRMDSTIKRLLSAINHINRNAQDQTVRTMIEEIELDLEIDGIESFDDSDYKLISLLLYEQYNTDGRIGLNVQERQAFLEGMGFPYNFDPSASSYDDLWDNAAVRNLEVREMVQFTWYVSGWLLVHSFLVGRDRNGLWFLYDQAGPYVRYADTREELRDAVRADADAGEYSLDIIASLRAAQGAGIIKLEDIWK